MLRIILILAIAACARAQVASAWPEANKLFRSDPQWLGSDGGFSIDLGNGRVFWSFGDTLVARKPGGTRKNAAFVRNTAAIQTGYDPSTASMKFFWRKGSHMEIFPSEGKIWMWPAHGFRLGNKLIVFCSRIATNPDKNSFGFQGVGSSAFLIDNPDAEPTAWKMRNVLTMPGKVMLGSAVVIGGDFIYIFCESEAPPIHDIFLARWRTADVNAGKFPAPEWWSGESWGGEQIRRPVMHEVSSEISVQADGNGGFIEVNSHGWGGTDIVMRRAPRLEGPWSGPQKLYRPPESDVKDVLVYAGKSHPELKGADLVVTYGLNGKDDDVIANDNLYYPKFVRINLDRPPSGRIQ
jgi:hypothetical protein